MAEPLRRIDVAERAVDDARQAVAYYLAKAPYLADLFEREVEEALSKVLKGPLHYAKYDGDSRRVLLRSFPYGVVYDVGESTIRVVAFVALRREPGYWKR